MRYIYLHHGEPAWDRIASTAVQKIMLLNSATQRAKLAGYELIYADQRRLINSPIDPEWVSLRNRCRNKADRVKAMVLVDPPVDWRKKIKAIYGV